MRGSTRATFLMIFNDLAVACSPRHGTPRSGNAIGRSVSDFNSVIIPANGSGLLTALRGLRSSVLAGLLWLAAIRIAVDPTGSEAESSAVWEAVQAIASVAPPTSEILALVVGAYLLGVFSEATLGAASRWFTVRIVREHRHLAEILPFVHAGPGGPAGEVNTMSGYLDTALGRAQETFTSDETSADDAAARVRAAWMKAREEGGPVVADIDRLRGEAEFRLYLVPPILAVAIAVARHGDWWLTALLPGLVLASVIAASANHAAESANDELAEWVRHRSDEEILL